MKIIDEVDKKDLLDERSTVVSEKEDLYVIESGGRQRFVYTMNNELSGRDFHLVMDTGYEYVIHFMSGETLAWARQGDPFVCENYKCAKGNPKTYLVSFVSGEESAPTCITLVLDLENNLVTMVMANKGVYPARNRLTTHQIVFGAIKIPGESLPMVRHGYTAELVGKKIAWQYSPSVKLTHIYISERYMRGSLKDMPPIDENTTDAQKEEIEDRTKRWNELFFEEPCFLYKNQQASLFGGYP